MQTWLCILSGSPREVHVHRLLILLRAERSFHEAPEEEQHVLVQPHPAAPYFSGQGFKVQVLGFRVKPLTPQALADLIWSRTHTRPHPCQYQRSLHPELFICLVGWQ